MRRRRVWRSHFSRLIARAARLGRNVNRHFEAATMRIGIERRTEQAAPHFGTRNRVFCIVHGAGAMIFRPFQTMRAQRIAITFFGSPRHVVSSFRLRAAKYLRRAIVPRRLGILRRLVSAPAGWRVRGR
jgi:hypothetical protein